MTNVSKRAALIAALVMTVVLCLVPTVSAAPKTRPCGTVSIVIKGGGTARARSIHATGYSCRLARVAVRACLRDRLRGWKAYTAPSLDDRRAHGLTGLDRGKAHVSFELHGRSGCA